MTALEILKAARLLVADGYEWDRWEARRKAEAEKTVGEWLPPFVVWAVKQASGGAMVEYVKALGLVTAAMGGSVEKFAGGWVGTLAAMDRAILTAQKGGK